MSAAASEAMRATPTGRGSLLEERRCAIAGQKGGLPFASLGRHQIGTADLITLRKAGLSSNLQAVQQVLNNNVTRRQRRNMLHEFRSCCTDNFLSLFREKRLAPVDGLPGCHHGDHILKICLE